MGATTRNTSVFVPVETVTPPCHRTHRTIARSIPALWILQGNDARAKRCPILWARNADRPYTLRVCINMSKTHVAQALLLVIATVAPATAAPRKRPPIKPVVAAPVAAAAFAQPVAFISCQKVTAFACGMRDSAGHTFGTAHESTMCSTLTFLPDGSFRQSGDLMGSAGSYRLINRDVEMRFTDEADSSPFTNRLTLNADGTKLGSMTLVVASSDNVTP